MHSLQPPDVRKLRDQLVRAAHHYGPAYVLHELAAAMGALIDGKFVPPDDESERDYHAVRINNLADEIEQRLLARAR